MDKEQFIQVDHQEYIDLDERDLMILHALQELKGRVASLNQLYKYIKEKYGGMAKKTFHKHIKQLIKKGYISCKSDNPRSGVECIIGERYKALDLYYILRKYMPPIGNMIKSVVEHITPFTIISFLDHYYYILLYDAIILAITFNKEDFNILNQALLFLAKSNIDSYFNSLLYMFQELDPKERIRIAEELLSYLKGYAKGWLKIWVKDKKSRKRLQEEFERGHKFMEYILKCIKHGGKIKTIWADMNELKLLCIKT